MRRGGTIQLLGDRRHLRGERDLEVVPAAAQVDDLLVVRVLEDALEHPFAQALAVTTEQLEGLGAHRTRRHRGVAGNERDRRSLDQVERLLPCQALTTAPHVVADLGACLLARFAARLDLRLGSPLGARRLGTRGRGHLGDIDRREFGRSGALRAFAAFRTLSTIASLTARLATLGTLGTLTALLAIAATPAPAAPATTAATLLARSLVVSTSRATRRLGRRRG